MDRLETMLGESKEIEDLIAGMLSSINDALEEVRAVGSLSGRQLPTHTFEREFREDLQPTRLIREQRTSSPVGFKSFIQNSVHADSSENAEFRSTQPDIPLEGKGPDSLLGEIAFQLDRRILSHVFQNRERLHGFTLLNISEKNREVSTLSSGELDEDYHLRLTQRYTDLMERLSQFRYKAALHSPFIENIVNIYGVLIEKPGENSTQEIDSNNPDLLRKLTLAQSQCPP
ncbi:speriolin-like isoform X1 [Cebidichthys violaceus]|uniref:speriolin-like isoform X1 n=1 Tax=Cebidichthys violaceus TaxID=271503 RepID=UPI0035C992FD